jgi:hypothetical protein
MATAVDTISQKATGMGPAAHWGVAPAVHSQAATFSQAHRPMVVAMAMATKLTGTVVVVCFARPLR